MFNLKNAKLENFEIIKACPRDPNKKARCTYYRIKPGSYVPERRKHEITDLPKGFFDEQIQEGIHRIG
jgi:hypothetical protein